MYTQYRIKALPSMKSSVEEDEKWEMASAPKSPPHC